MFYLQIALVSFIGTGITVLFLLAIERHINRD